MAPQPDDHPHVPGPSLWPIGFAVGVVVLLVGLVVSWVIIGVGAIIAVVFALLWVRDLTAGTALAQAPDVEAESAAAAEQRGARAELDWRSATRARSSSSCRRSVSAV